MLTGDGVGSRCRSESSPFPTSSGPKWPCFDRAITDFVEWYCSEPRLAFNSTVVLGYRIFLEQKLYAATTINLRLAAV